MALTSASTPTYVSGGIASVAQKSLVVTSLNTTVNGGLVLGNGNFTQKVLTITGTPATLITLDLAQANVFYLPTVTATNVAFTAINDTIGATFYVSILGDSAHTISFTGTSFTNIVVGGAVAFTNASPTVSGTLAASRYLFTCVVVSA